MNHMTIFKVFHEKQSLPFSAKRRIIDFSFPDNMAAVPENSAFLSAVGLSLDTYTLIYYYSI